jgi:predicted transposase YdaD
MSIAWLHQLLSSLPSAMECRMTKNIPNPHDRFFHAAMKKHALAEEFFKANLPQKILEALDLESLRLLETSFIEENLKEERSDVLFECKIQKAHH